MKKSFFASWRASFFTGLAVALPAIVSIAAILWIFKTVSNLTDSLLSHRDDATLKQGGLK